MKFWNAPRLVDNKKKVKNQSYKRIEENVKPNLLKRKFNTDRPNKIWTTDITYLIYNNKRAYLSTILDLYDRKIVYSFKKRYLTFLVKYLLI